jgi:PST family polysaccharide transporter
VASIGYHVGDVYKAIGRPNILLNMTILTLALMVPALLIGQRFGLIGVAWGYVVAVFIERMISLFLAVHFIKIPLVDILSQFIPSIRGGAVMSAVTLPVLYLTTSLPPFAQLALMVFIGAMSYLGVLWWTERENLVQLIKIIRKSDSPATTL